MRISDAIFSVSNGTKKVEILLEKFYITNCFVSNTCNSGHFYMILFQLFRRNLPVITGRLSSKRANYKCFCKSVNMYFPKKQPVQNQQKETLSSDLYPKIKDKDTIATSMMSLFLLLTMYFHLTDLHLYG